MKKVIKLTESDLTRIVKRVIQENKESAERDARIVLNHIGYSYSVLKHYSRQELIDALKRESEDRFNTEKYDELIGRLKSH